MSDRMKANATILIAEDDFGFRDTLEDVLAEEGYSVSVARNGAEALGVLGRIGRPVLILLDMNMPVMDGMTFLAHLKEWPDREQVEVVIMSAAVEVELLFGHTPGVLKALKKPFDVEEILVLAEEFAARHAPAGASTASTATQPTAVTAGTPPPPAAPEE
jgi:CheY-like chemotaxis protein